MIIKSGQNFRFLGRPTVRYFRFARWGITHLTSCSLKVISTSMLRLNSISTKGAPCQGQIMDILLAWRRVRAMRFSKAFAYPFWSRKSRNWSWDSGNLDSTGWCGGRRKTASRFQNGQKCIGEEWRGDIRIPCSETALIATISSSSVGGISVCLVCVWVRSVWPALGSAHLSVLSDSERTFFVGLTVSYSMG
jgi:hypothetical protein